MKLAFVGELLLVPLLLAGTASQLVANSDSLDKSRGVLVGTVTKGPFSPVERQGGPPAFRGVAGARIDIATEQGKQVISVVTDASGNFKVRLPDGTYNLTMPSMHGAMFTRDLPATVTIAAGVVKRVNIHLDTGIR